LLTSISVLPIAAHTRRVAHEIDVSGWYPWGRYRSTQLFPESFDPKIPVVPATTQSDEPAQDDSVRCAPGFITGYERLQETPPSEVSYIAQPGAFVESSLRRQTDVPQERLDHRANVEPIGGRSVTHVDPPSVLWAMAAVDVRIARARHNFVELHATSVNASSEGVVLVVHTAPESVVHTDIAEVRSVSPGTSFPTTTHVDGEGHDTESSPN
jgi:hypothetical protein